MNAIRHDLEDQPDVVAVWFNAWRYEKEEHLIVPLLDTIREELLDWGDGRAKETESVARGMASAVGKAARAVLAGLTLHAGIPGAVDASLDANKVAAAWRARTGPGQGRVRADELLPRELHGVEAGRRETFIADQGDPGPEHTTRRFVVFIDDLDRCLPDKALQVLESMKLFFDLDGFVFVVGLDQRVIERAVQVKYPADSTDQQGGPGSYLSGVDYVKKIFQVQFTTPRIDQGDLPQFLETIAAAAELPGDQRQDLRDVVTPQVRHLAEHGLREPA